MRNQIIPYNPDLKSRARKLRNNQTEAEKLVWERLRKKATGVEFHRQVPLLNYIVDFYCHEIGLAIEIDGNIHNHNFLEDAERQGEIEKYGVEFLRFTNKQVYENLNKAIKVIALKIEEKNN